MYLKAGALVNFYQICCLVNADPNIISKNDLNILINNVDVAASYVDFLFNRYPQLVPVYTDDDDE